MDQRIMNVQIEQDDWRAVMRLFDGPRTLFYLDTPYVPDTRVNGGYRHELKEDDHRKLVEYLLAVQGMVVLSGYAHESYKPLESAGWTRQDHDVQAYASDSRARRTECLWRSPQSCQTVRKETKAIYSPVR
jgi:DNA adenine methylase